MCPNFVISDFSRFHLIFNLTFYVLNLMEELISQSTLGWFYQCITSSFCACRSQKSQKDIDCLFLTVFFRFWDLVRASRKHLVKFTPCCTLEFFVPTWSQYCFVELEFYIVQFLLEGLIAAIFITNGLLNIRLKLG